MKKYLRRPLFAFTLGAALAAAVLLGQAAYATDGTIEACFKPSNGTLYLLGGSSGRTTCQAGDMPISWNAAGLDGEDGEDGQDVTSEQLAPDADPACPTGGSKFTSVSGVTYACNGSDGQDGDDGEDFAGTFTSPNGAFSLSVDDSGARLEGPNGRIRLGNDGIRLEGVLGSLRLTTGETALRSSALLTLQANGPLTATGANLVLGSGPCAPAARAFVDLVSVSTETGFGSVIAGSPSVCIGG